MSRYEKQYKIKIKKFFSGIKMFNFLHTPSVLKISDSNSICTHVQQGLIEPTNAIEMESDISRQYYNAILDLPQSRNGEFQITLQCLNKGAFGNVLIGWAPARLRDNVSTTLTRVPPKNIRDHADAGFYMDKKAYYKKGFFVGTMFSGKISSLQKINQISVNTYIRLVYRPGVGIYLKSLDKTKQIFLFELTSITQLVPVMCFNDLNASWKILTPREEELLSHSQQDYEWFDGCTEINRAAEVAKQQRDDERKKEEEDFLESQKQKKAKDEADRLAEIRRKEENDAYLRRRQDEVKAEHTANMADLQTRYDNSITKLQVQITRIKNARELAIKSEDRIHASLIAALEPVRSTQRVDRHWELPYSDIAEGPHSEIPELAQYKLAVKTKKEELHRYWLELSIKYIQFKEYADMDSFGFAQKRAKLKKEADELLASGKNEAKLLEAYKKIYADEIKQRTDEIEEVNKIEPRAMEAANESETNLRKLEKGEPSLIILYKKMGIIWRKLKSVRDYVIEARRYASNAEAYAALTQSKIANEAVIAARIHLQTALAAQRRLEDKIKEPLSDESLGSFLRPFQTEENIARKAAADAEEEAMRAQKEAAKVEEDDAKVKLEASRELERAMVAVIRANNAAIKASQLLASFSTVFVMGKMKEATIKKLVKAAQDALEKSQQLLITSKFTESIEQSQIAIHNSDEAHKRLTELEQAVREKRKSDEEEEAAAKNKKDDDAAAKKKFEDDIEQKTQERLKKMKDLEDLQEQAKDLPEVNRQQLYDILGLGTAPENQNRESINLLLNRYRKQFNHQIMKDKEIDIDKVKNQAILRALINEDKINPVAVNVLELARYTKIVRAIIREIQKYKGESYISLGVRVRRGKRDDLRKTNKK
jgi:hypothetical protein